MIQLDEPPIGQGCDAVAAWAQRAQHALAVGEGGRDGDDDESGDGLGSRAGRAQGGAGRGGVAQGGGEREKALLGCLGALAGTRRAAQEAEALLQAAAQRGEVVADAAGPESPQDEVALVLWQWFELARVCYAVAVLPGLAGEALDGMARQATGLKRCIQQRPTARAEEVRRVLRLPRDVRQAVREHEEVSQKLAEEALDEGAVKSAQDTLIGFCQWMQRDFIPAKHLEFVAAKLEAVERGEIRRIIINFPPRMGKSQLATRHFVAWLFGRDPTTDVILGTHSQDFADEMGGDIRDAVNSDVYQRVFPGTHCAPDSKAKKTFKIVKDAGDGKEDRRGRRGVCKVYGRGGSPTGSGAKYLILDDLVGEKEADRDSPAMERDIRVALRQFRTRLAPHGAIVVINTRYSERDVVGVLTTAYADDGPWESISFPMFAEEVEDHAMPDGTVWHREIGDVLWPGRYPPGELEALRAAMLRECPEQWWAQFQCSIVPTKGAIVDLDAFKRYASVDEVRRRTDRITVSVDTSKGASSGARTAVTVWLESVGKVSGGDGAHLGLAEFGVWQYPEIRRRVKEVCRQWKPHALLIEDKSTGEALVQDLRTDTDWPRTPITAIHPVQDKVTRMSVCMPQVKDGQVWLPAKGALWAQWLPEYEKELMFFPNGKLKDLCDSTSQFLNWRRDNPMVGTGGVIGGQDAAQLQHKLSGSWGTAGMGAARGGGARSNGRF